jgi:hypothetical protein
MEAGWGEVAYRIVLGFSTRFRVLGFAEVLDGSIKEKKEQISMKQDAICFPFKPLFSPPPRCPVETDMPPSKGCVVCFAACSLDVLLFAFFGFSDNIVI